MGWEDFLLNVLAGAGSSVLYSAAYGLFEKSRSRHELKQAVLRIDEASWVRDLPEDETGDIPDPGVVFSRHNLDKLISVAAKKGDEGNRESLLRTIIGFMDGYDIPYEKKRYYARYFLLILLENVRDADPGRFDAFYQGNLEQEILEELRSIQRKMDQICCELQSYRKDTIRIFSSDEKDLQLRRETDKPKIGISFFDIDDEEFQKKFAEQCHSSCVYVMGRSREETLYCVLNELQRLDDSRRVYVVEDEASWKRLQSKEMDGVVLIAYFYMSEIPAIEGATSIFVLPEKATLVNKEILHLSPRMYMTIVDGLERAGLDAEKAGALVQETHGLYVPLKKKIYNGAYLKKPEWITGLSEEILKTGLLLGAWTDREGDRAAIESLSGLSYAEFMQKLLPYMDGEDPFIYVSGQGQSKCYTLACAENSWDYVQVSVDEPIWSAFESCFKKIMSASEPLLSCDEHAKLQMQLKGGDLKWSCDIRKGMIRTFLLHDYYCGAEIQRSNADQIVREILAGVASAGQWRYISGFFSGLCEMSPESALARLEREWGSPTGLRSLFCRKSEGVCVPDYNGQNILSGVKLLLTLRQYAARAWKWLLQMDNLPDPYAVSGTDSIVQWSLCTWASFTAFHDPASKIAAAQSALLQDYHAWSQLYGTLTLNNRTMFGWQDTPEYREYCQMSKAPDSEVWETESAYLKLLVEHTDFKTDRWLSLIKYALKSHRIWEPYFTERFETETGQMEDGEIADIKNGIRRLIYQQRYYHSDKDGDEITPWLEELLGSLHTTIPEFEYVYLFVNNGTVPLLHPTVHDGKRSREENEKRAEELIGRCFEALRANGDGPEELIRICAGRHNSLGRALGRYWNDGAFSSEVFHALISCQKSGEMAAEYIANIAEWSVEILPDCLNILRDCGCESTCAAQLYRVEARRSDGLPLIAGASEEIRHEYWKGIRCLYESHIEWQLSECRKYGTLQSYLELLFQANESCHFTPVQLLHYLIGIEGMERTDELTTAAYLLKELLRPVQEEFYLNREICASIARIEVVFYRILEWTDMKCYQEMLKRSPEPFAEMVSIIFRHGDQSDDVRAEADLKHVEDAQRLFYMSEFCPAERDGQVDLQELHEWLESLKILLEHSNQIRLYGFLAGRLLAYSPSGEDGHYPCEAVRSIIEEEADESMMQEYASTVYNQRGLYTFSAGRNERMIAQSCLDNAEYLCIQYPRTAEIYYRLADSYKRDARWERRNAENRF